MNLEKSDDLNQDTVVKKKENDIRAIFAAI